MTSHLYNVHIIPLKYYLPPPQAKKNLLDKFLFINLMDLKIIFLSLIKSTLIYLKTYFNLEFVIF